MVKDPKPLLLGATSVCSCPIRCQRLLQHHLLHLPPPQHIQVSSSTEKHWRRRHSFISIYRCSQAAAGKDISPHPCSNTTHAFKNLPGLSLSRVIASVTWPPLRAAPPPPSDLMGCEAAKGGRRAGEELYTACYFGSDSWRVFLLRGKLV